MIGFLNIDKPRGLTSRDVVSRIQRQVRPEKVGHAGTLDPLASGVLLIAVGSATRLIPAAQQLGKRYRAEFLFGQSSPGDDLEHEVTQHPELPMPEREQIEGSLSRFVGLIQQIPPAYSAVKVKGQRAYDLARAGEAVELTSREVRIDELRLIEYESPRLALDIACGSGTYIRSLGRDLAEALGTVAVMSSLQRTAIGEFSVADAVSLEDLEQRGIERCLQSPLRVVPEMPRLTVTAGEIAELRLGRPIACPEASTDRRFDSAEEIAAIDERGDLVALGEWRVQTGHFQPRKLFVKSSS